MNILNLTPHAISLLRGNGTIETIQPSGTVARLETIEKLLGEVAGLPVVTRTTGSIIGLPEPIAGTIFVVSSMVLDATSRQDVFAPDTGPTAVRDDGGRIQAVRRLVGK